MADLSQNEKINLAFKMVFGIQGTSNTEDSSGLDWFEERHGFRPFLLNQDLYVEIVPKVSTSSEADLAVTANPAMIEKVTLKLTKVVGTNDRAWVAFQTPGNDTSPILGEWLIPQIFGKGYAMKLFKDNGSGAPGQEITTTEGAWVPSYKMGFIILGAGYTAANLGWTEPLWVTVYRYIGAVGLSGGTIPGLSMDSTYNGGSTISVDNGPVVLNASNNYAPLQLTPISYTPTTNVAGGQIANIDGILYSYDSTRNKWLSVYQPSISFQARKGDANYLSTGFHSDLNSGYVAINDGTILGITAQGGSGNQSKGFAIRKNGVMTDITTLSLTAGTYKNNSLNVDFSSGDILQVYCTATGAPINDPRVNIIFSWRK